MLIPVYGKYYCFLRRNDIEKEWGYESTRCGWKSDFISFLLGDGGKVICLWTSLSHRNDNNYDQKLLRSLIIYKNG